MSFKLERNDRAHLYGIRHYCSPLPRDAGFRAGTRSIPSARRTDTAHSAVQPGHTEHTGRRRQGSETGIAREAQTSDEDMQSLRKSIDATPEAASALKAKGLSSSQVVAINIADGVLTLFAKTA